MEVVVFSFLFLGLLLTVGISLDRGLRRGPLTEALRAMEGGERRRSEVRGRRKGYEMTFRLTLRSEGDHSQEWTEVSAAVPRLPIMVDLKVVGRDFDEAFQIEAAPADVVERFLDPELRHALYALHPCTLQVDDGRIVWERVGWMEHGIMVEQALDLMAHAMARYRSAFSEADAQVLANAPAAGAPFRGIPDQAVVAAARSAREAEVAALAEQRSRRKPDFRPELLYGLLAGVVILAFVTLVVLL